MFRVSVAHLDNIAPNSLKADLVIPCDLMPNELAVLFLGNAVGFCQAAKRIAAGGSAPAFPWPPFFACIGYSLELSLKAYVLERGGSEVECQKAIRHDLLIAVTMACDRGMATPSEALMSMIARIGPYHKNHSFRYMKPVDVAILPEVEEALAVTDELLLSIAQQLPELLPSDGGDYV